MHLKAKLPLKPLAAAFLGALLSIACSGSGQGGAASASAAPPAPTVTVLRVETEAAPLFSELPGRTTPYLIAEVRPQVTGIVKERPFVEGSEVEAGQLLYQIDPALYQAAYDSAKASLARAEANLQMTQLKAERYAGLEKSDAVSKQSNDEAMAEARQAQADVAAAKAALDKARIELDYTQVTSPIGGRIGRSTVTPGALVTANQPASASDRAAARSHLCRSDPVQRRDPAHPARTGSGGAARADRTTAFRSSWCWKTAPSTASRASWPSPK
jgi:membrane fusion protein, multidrug efflux system